MILALASLLLAAPLWATAATPAGASAVATVAPVAPVRGSGGGHDHSFRVLAFTKGASRATADAGVEALRKLGRDRGFTVDATDDARRFNERSLERYRVVVFLDTTGVVLDDAGRAAFEAYFRAGGGFVGIGSAIETEPEWAFLTDVLGTRAQGRTAVQAGTVKVADRVHDATEDLPEYWTRTDAWYNFTSNVRGFSHVLATVVEQPFALQPWGGSLSAIAGGTMGADHPVSWCKDYQGGRSFYTALGTRAQSFAEAKLRTHLGGAVRWAAGRSDPTYSDCGATVLANYQQTKLAAPPNLAEPIGFDVLPDGRVLQTDRLGGVRLHDPAANTTTALANIPVYTHSEDGMYGPAIDDDFATNRWVYLYYAPQTVEDVKLSDGRVVTQTTPTAAAPNTAASVTAWDPYVGYFQLSRFKLVDGPAPHLDLASEQQILRVPVNRGACCHVAGDIDFDDRGNLWLVTGDDTPAGGGSSGGFGPFNDQLTADGLFNAPHVDARRSALNTNDLRGKVLRIDVDDQDIAAADENRLGGAYSVPRGNLFRSGTAGTRPEIYAMGLRNPFRIQVDGDGVAYVADYSPDSRVPQVDRGPAGTGRIIAVREPANYGWPLCYSTDLAYYRWNFVTVPGQPLDTPPQRFTCDDPDQGPPNDSRWNLQGGPTVEPGLRQTPPVTDPDVWYSFDDNNGTPPLGTPCSAYYDGTLPAEQRVCPQLFPELGPGGGVGPHTATVYEYDRRGDDPTRLPPYFDGALFFGEFTRDYLREIRLDSQDRVFKINNALDCGGVRTPAAQRFGFECDSPMDAQFDEDGHFYLLTYGDGFFQANADAGLYRWDYVKGQRSPIAELSATPTSGQAPLVVQFSSEGSRDPDPADSISFEWDLDGDGTVDSVDPDPTFTYTSTGTFVARLTVSDSSGRTASANTTITVGNTAPTVTVDVPTDGGLFAFGESIPFEVTVTDPEDGTIDCNRVEVTFVLAHDAHGHAEDSVTGCSGSLSTIADDAAHGGNVWGVVSASYTDLGGSGGVPALTTVAQANVRQKRAEVEFVVDESGTNVQTTNDPDGGGQQRGSLGNGDWVRLNGPYDLVDIDGLTFRVSSSSATVPAGSPMAAVEVRLDAVDGPLLTTTTLTSTGAAGTWASQTFPITDPDSPHQIYLVFRSVPGGQGGNNLFLLNWAQFEGQGVAG